MSEPTPPDLRDPTRSDVEPVQVPEGSVRRALDEIVLSSLHPIAWVLAALYAVFAVSHALVLDAEVAGIMAPVAAGSALIFVVGALALGRLDPDPSAAHPVAAAMALVVMVNSLLHMGLTWEPFQTTNLLLLILGVGILFLDVGWFGVVVTACLLGWLVVAGIGPYSPTWVHFGFSLVGATILSWAILALRIRTFRRLEELHLQDRVRQLELESALTRTEALRRGEADARRALESAVSRLKESEERFRRLADATFEGILIHRDGRVVDANRRAAELFGTSLPDLLRCDLRELFTADSRLDGLGPGRTEDAPATEARGVRFDGTEFPAEVASTEATHRGEPATVTVVRDVSTHTRAREALRQAARDAEASNRAKSTFLANMSHELRTPLNAVIGFSNILRKNRSRGLSEREVEYVERIVTNGKHLLRLIDDVLDLSKVEAGRMEVVTEEVDLPGLVGEILRSVELQAQRKGVELRACLPDDLRPLRTDPQRLRQILLNLVGNAVKFTAEGGVTLRVRAQGGGVPARIEVVDTGIGIPAARLPHVFDAFQQVDGSTARRFGGTGLGLTISRSLCEILGYRLTARSTEGKGSTFIVHLRPGTDGGERDVAGEDRGSADVPAGEAAG